jgi:hypothetical protein
MSVSMHPFPWYCKDINTLKPEDHLNKNSVRTAKKTQHFTITKINWLTLFREIIAVYCENYMKPVVHSVGKM